MTKSHKMNKFVCQISCLCTLLLGLICPADATPSLTVLGLPLGGDIGKIKKCAANTDIPKNICWISKPFTHKQSGMTVWDVLLPKPTDRPAWAAYGSVKLITNKQGLLDAIEISTTDNSDHKAITRSISSRFGLPTSQTTLSSQSTSTTWDLSTIYITSLCFGRCVVEFKTRSMVAAEEIERKNRPTHPLGP
jgi:hypothetical protein